MSSAKMAAILSRGRWGKQEGSILSSWLMAWWYKEPSIRIHFDALVHDCSNSSALAMELLQSCTKQLISSPPQEYLNWYHDVIKWKHFPRYWPFVRGIHRSPVNFPHKGQWRGALMFSLIWAWMNGWINNGKASDLRHYLAHYEVTVMTGGSFNIKTLSSQYENFHYNRNTVLSLCNDNPRTLKDGLNIITSRRTPFESGPR